LATRLWSYGSRYGGRVLRLLSPGTGSINPSTYGQLISFTATVTAISPVAGTPTGTVTFKDQGIVLETLLLDDSAQAVFSISSLIAVADTMPSWGNMNVAIDMMFGPKAVFFPSMNKSRGNWVAALNASMTTEKVDVALEQKAMRVLYDNASVIPVNEAGKCYVWQPYVKDAGFGDRGAYFWTWAQENVWLDK
jgi:hypothetical protein